MIRKRFNVFSDEWDSNEGREWVVDSKVGKVGDVKDVTANTAYMENPLLSAHDLGNS